jgi:hypothetical protein
VAPGHPLDTSVALAQLLAEDRRPPAALWAETEIQLATYDTRLAGVAGRLGIPLAALDV